MSTIKVDTIATRTGSGNITASNTIVGNITGNVTGNVTGNQSGGTISATSITASSGATITGSGVPLNINSSNSNANKIGFQDNGSAVSFFGGVSNGLFFGNSSGTQIGRLDADGLKFGTDTAAANGIGDYEEGTWLPQYAGSAADGSVTYTARVGVYTKIGRLVRVWGDISISASSGMSGIAIIRGLPYSSASASNLGSETGGFSGQSEQRYDMGMMTFWDVGTGFTSSRSPTGWMTNGVQHINMYSHTGDSASGHSGMLVNQTGRIAFSLIYTTDS